MPLCLLRALDALICKTGHCSEPADPVFFFPARPGVHAPLVWGGLGLGRRSWRRGDRPGGGGLVRGFGVVRFLFLFFCKKKQKKKKRGGQKRLVLRLASCASLTLTGLRAATSAALSPVTDSTVRKKPLGGGLGGGLRERPTGRKVHFRFGLSLSLFPPSLIFFFTSSRLFLFFRLPSEAMWVPISPSLFFCTLTHTPLQDDRGSRTTEDRGSRMTNDGRRRITDDGGSRTTDDRGSRTTNDGRRRITDEKGGRRRRDDGGRTTDDGRRSRDDG